MLPPLAAIKVLEVGDLGELAGKLLAAAGADVVRVEPPSGAASRHSGPFAGDRPDVNGSLAYIYWNTTKRSVTLDLARPDALPLWRGLVTHADVVIDSTAPTFLDSLAAGYDAFAGLDSLVWCSITPFGRDGPWRDFLANDLIQLALGGTMMSCGYDDHELPPIRPDGGHACAMAGQYAVIAVLAALNQARRTGKGQLIDVSIHEAVSATTEGAFFNWEYSGQVVRRQTGRHASASPTQPWQLQTADGGHVCLMGGGFPRDERVWRALLAWMAELGADATMPVRDFASVSREQRPAAVEAIHAFVRSQPAETVYRRGQGAHLPWGKVRRPEENLDDPHWQDRGFFQEVEVHGVDRTARIPGAPFVMSATPLRPPSRAPLLGEHNLQVYSELGLSPDDLAALARAGVI